MSDFQQVLDSRSKRLDNFSYKLAGSNYGLDVAIADDAEIDESAMAAWILFADGNRRDGVGDLLEVGGIDTSRHRKNPIVLFDHGKGNSEWAAWPIALAEDPQTKAYTVEINPELKTARVKAFWYQGQGIQGADRTKEKEFAVYCEQLFHLWAKRYIRAGSIGYQVVAARELPSDYGVPKGLHLLSTLMLEASAVVLPANGDTVTKVLAMPSVCGKPLSPILVKSLTPFASEKKVQMGYEKVPVPFTEDLSKTDIPPVKWKPGVGAVNSKLLKTLREKYKGGLPFPKSEFDRVMRALSHLDEYQVDAFVDKLRVASRGGEIWESYADYGDPIHSDQSLFDFIYREWKEAKRRTGRKSINVRWKNKVVKGFAQIEMKFDTSKMNINQQNKFVIAMSKAGYGLPKGGRFATTDPPALNNSMKLMAFNYALSPEKSMDDASVGKNIGEAAAIARKHGAKFLGNLKSMTSNTKSIQGVDMAQKRILREVKSAPDGLPDDNDVPDNETLEGVEREEPYGAQVLRRLHEDHSLLMKDYDEMMGPLENEGVKGHLQGKLEHIGEFLTKTEELFGNSYPDLKGFDTGDDESEIEEESEEKDMDTMDDDAVSADSEEEDLPDGDEVLEGMAKRLNYKEVKEIRGKYAKKSSCKKCGKPACKCTGTKSLVRVKAGEGNYNMQMVGGLRTDYQQGKGWWVVGPGGKKVSGPYKTEAEAEAAVARGGKSIPGDEEHQRKPGKVTDNIPDTDPGNEENENDLPGEETDNLPETDPGNEEFKNLPEHQQGAVGEASGYLKELGETEDYTDEHRMKSYHYHKTLDSIAQIQDGIDHSDVMDKGFDDQDEIHAGEDGDLPEEVEDDAKGLSCVKNASSFLKDLSQTQEFGDEHRGKAVSFAKAMDDWMGASEEEKEFDEMDEQDAETDVTEPGEMGEKATRLKLKKTLLDQNKALVELSNKLKKVKW